MPNTWCCKSCAAPQKGEKIAAKKDSVPATERSFINVNLQMRTNLPHKAVHESHAAAEMIASELQGNKLETNWKIQEIL